MKYLFGDIHGKREDFIARIMRIELDRGEPLNRDDTIFCLGDVGLRYGSGRSRGLEKALREMECTIFIIRGNHDTRYVRDLKRYVPTVKQMEWNGGTVYLDGRHPNILYAPDCGGYYTIDGDGVLVIPGAYSVDHDVRRICRYPLERDEMLTPHEWERIIDYAKNNRVNYVLSHTAPRRWEKEYEHLFAPNVPQSMVNKMMEDKMDEVLDLVSEHLKGWYFGHFHGDLHVADGVGHLLQHKYMILGKPELH